MTTMVWINVLLAVPFIALWAGHTAVARAEAPGRQAAAGRRGGAGRPADASAARARRLPPRRVGQEPSIPAASPV